LINSYTTGLAPSVLKNVLRLALPEGNVEADEVGLPIRRGNLVLPCGASGRWTPHD
jgi:23S rRNA (cytosine1962-C5)-methyltransferase